jgi:DNA-directed RNA polymerase subunit omega
MDLKSIEAAKRMVGGSFRLSVLLQKRIIELVRGAPPVVENADKERGPIEVALREILENKISLEMIEPDEFDKLVEQARQEREARAAANEAEAGAPPPKPAGPTLDLMGDHGKS